MNTQDAKVVLDRIFGDVFGYKNPMTMEQFMLRFTYDLRLPQKVFDSSDGTPTWALLISSTKFITSENVVKRHKEDEWLMAKRPLDDIQDVLNAWNEINFTATERHINSRNVGESDNIYNSQNIYRSQDVRYSENILLSDTIDNCKYVAASQRSNNSRSCIRLEDSKECVDSFNISWSAKIERSFFMHDCLNMQDSMFCSHMANKRFCIANMQFEEKEYMKIRDKVIKWILQP